jgi:hypothetical protein
MSIRDAMYAAEVLEDADEIVQLLPPDLKMSNFVEVLQVVNLWAA